MRYNAEEMGCSHTGNGRVRRRNLGALAGLGVTLLLATTPALAGPRRRGPVCEPPFEPGLRAVVATNVGGTAVTVIDREDGRETWQTYAAWGLSGSLWWEERRGGVGIGYCRTDLINIRIPNFGWRKYGYFLEFHAPPREGVQGFGGLGWTEGRLGNEPKHYPWSVAGRVGIRVWEERRRSEEEGPQAVPMGEATVVGDDQGVVVSLGVGIRF